MTDTLAKANQDIAPEWLELTNSVRKHSAACMDDTTASDHVKNLSREALALCDHVDRLHDDLRELLSALESSKENVHLGLSDDREIDFAAIEIQRETHEMRADPFDILKALLMWRDDPAERLRRKE